MIVPCKNCSKRGCGKYHDKCVLYLEFCKIQQAEYQRRKINVQNMHKFKREI